MRDAVGGGRDTDEVVLTEELVVVGVWPSAAVENTCGFLVEIVVLREMSLLMMPPRVSIPIGKSE